MANKTCVTNNMDLQLMMNQMMMNQMMNNQMMNNPMMNNPMMNNQMMNNQMMMYQMMNNQMMMNQMMNNPMMNNSMTMINNPMMMGLGFNMMNNINNYNNNQFNNIEKPNCKKVMFYYDDKFIQNVDIYNDNNYEYLRNKLLSILKSSGIILYRRPFPNEIIERKSEKETLENLIERGVEEKNPNLVIFDKCNREKNFLDKNIFDEIKEGDKVSLEIPLRGAGSPLIEFVDVEKITQTKKLKFSKNSPKWRKASIGLNLFGKCINKKCEAYNKEVIYIVGINVKFDFDEEKKSIVCPICKKNFIPLTVGFWKCEYQIKGEKLDDGEYKNVEINGRETSGDDFEYYDPYKGKSFWSNLIIFACHRQKMKYKK